MAIPRKITPCPILESIIEIRFTSKDLEEMIFGLIYKEFRDQFPIFEKLPILQIPEHIRDTNPDFMYSPSYRMSKDNLILQIGKRVVSIANTKEYIGWEIFSEIIYTTFAKIFEIISIIEVNRLAVRYINLFQGINILEKSNLKILLKDESLSHLEISLTLNMPKDKTISKLTLANRAKAVFSKQEYHGSIVDIDTVLKKCPTDFQKNNSIFKECIEQAHIEEKEVFFSLLDENYLNTLSPEY